MRSERFGGGRHPGDPGAHADFASALLVARACAKLIPTMDVSFRRTGERRYAVVVAIAGEPPQVMDPAPGFDDRIPHDLVHYVVEAELGLTSGVFGRAAGGGGTFLAVARDDRSPRERARERRKQLRREASLRNADESRQHDMATSERLAAICDLAWRRRHGQRPDASRSAPDDGRLSPDDAQRVARVVDRLDELAPRWNQLSVGAELVFTWPSVVPRAAGQGDDRVVANRDPTTRGIRAGDHP